MFGPPGSGRSCQTQLLSQNLGFVHLSISNMLRCEVIQKTPLGSTIGSFIESYTHVPNDIVMNLLKHSLTGQDVKLNGFVLEGFPKTFEQLELAKQHLESSIFILLDCENNICYPRVENKIYDTILGEQIEGFEG